MRFNELLANDWQVIAEYMEVLKPLKIVTERLESHSKDGCFSTIYEVIPVFEQLLSDYEIRIK